MNWKDVYKLPLHVQELEDGHVLNYVWAENGAMSLMFGRGITEHDKYMIVKVINGDINKAIPELSYDNGTIKHGDRDLVTIRGWGHLTGVGGLNLDGEKAAEIQDEFAKYVFERLTGKKLEL